MVVQSKKRLSVSVSGKQLKLLGIPSLGKSLKNIYCKTVFNKVIGLI